MRRLFAVNSEELGDGKVIFEWNHRGTLLAVAGPKRKVIVYDRNGKLCEELHLSPPEVPVADDKLCSCVTLQWDAAGEQLAILPAGNSFVYVWAAATRDLQKLETDFKSQEVTMLVWSKVGASLAVGTAKGNVQLYNTQTARKVPIVGKHTKRVVCGVWNRDNMLALAGMDKTVTVSDGSSGDTVWSFPFKGEPQEMCVADKKEDGTMRREENTYTLITSKKVLYLMQASRDGGERAPIELSFQEHYGAMQRHLWFGDGFMMVGFRSGQVVVVSSHSKEIGEEVHSLKPLEVLTDMAHCPALGRVAVGGGSQVKVLDVVRDCSELQGSSIELGASVGLVDRLAWSKDGQVLTVGTASGHVSTYLAALPTVYGAKGVKVAALSSLAEVTVTDVRSRAAVRVELASEPAFCGVGPEHLAVGMNNQACFYSHGPDRTRQLISRRDYLCSISAVHLSSTHAAILSPEGRLIVHPIEPPPGSAPDEHDMQLPPQGSTQQGLSCVGLTEHFVVTGNKAGALCHYLVQGLACVNEYRHSGGGILQVFPQPSGPRLLFEDERHNVYMFNAVNDQIMSLPEFDGNLDTVLWDASDPSVFMASDGSSLWIYVHTPSSASGPSLSLVSKARLPATHTPLVLDNGSVHCRLKSGAMDVMVLETHRALQAEAATSKGMQQKKFAQAMKLLRLNDAWAAAQQLRSPDSWRQLGSAALQQLNVELAIGAFRQAGDASMVMSLEGLKGIEDRNLLAGHVLVMLEKDYTEAQELFLRSARPLAALEMRKDLKHWQQALTLAEQLAPDAVPAIGREHGAALELVGEHAQARSHYQQALQTLATVQDTGSGPADQDLALACQAGIARTTLHLGDVRGGRALALQLGGVQLFRECGAILEGMQQLQEAAEMYERAGMVEKAASIHLQSKNFAGAAPLMSKITSAKLQLQFAKAKESEGRFAEAASAYETAGELDSVVRLCLTKLSNPAKAYALVRKSKSATAAALLARHCLAAGDHRGAVEFLLLGQQMDQAFDVAQAKGEMDAFAEFVAASAAAPADFERIARYYQDKGQLDKAADMWSKCDQYPKALQLYLKVGSIACVNKAIELVEVSRSSALGVQVMDFIGEMAGDGSVKDELRFKLNMALGQPVEAARDALEMARFEQDEGNYKVAHTKLLGTVKQLEGLGCKPPQELMRALCLLHSYILVKSLVAINDHSNAARMLVRVAQNISKFPKHVVPILTSTVIECQRAGLKRTAYEYASMLMRPEYRSQISEKYKKKIELMVRKPDKSEEAEEQLAECPFCQLPGPETELQCLSCQSVIPFDIATGKRMQLADWSECPCCHFACSSQQFLKVLMAERHCPMCNQEVALDAVKAVADPISQLRR